MVAEGFTDELRRIIGESASCLNFSQARGLSILMCQVSDYLSSGMVEKPDAAFGCVGNLKAFYDVWLFLDCPGLADEVVVRRLKESGLWDALFTSMGWNKNNVAGVP